MSSSWLQTIRHATFKVFSDRFTQEQTSRCVTRFHRVCSVISPDRVPSLLRYSLFWDITWCPLVIIYRVSSFITDCLPLKTGPLGFTETSANNYQSTQRNIPEGGRSLSHGGGSVKNARHRLKDIVRGFYCAV
jgi:hypothetical protein